jgi:hypothetical protein
MLFLASCEFEIYVNVVLYYVESVFFIVLYAGNYIFILSSIQKGRLCKYLRSIVVVCIILIPYKIL